MRSLRISPAPQEIRISFALLVVYFWLVDNSEIILSKQNPSNAFFESRCVFQHSYTCCNTQYFPETRERKRRIKMNVVLYGATGKLRPTYFEGTYQSRA